MYGAVPIMDIGTRPEILDKQAIDQWSEEVEQMVREVFAERSNLIPTVFCLREPEEGSTIFSCAMVDSLVGAEASIDTLMPIMLQDMKVYAYIFAMECWAVHAEDVKDVEDIYDRYDSLAEVPERKEMVILRFETHTRSWTRTMTVDRGEKVILGEAKALDDEAGVRTTGRMVNWLRQPREEIQ